jgi:O-glycosyl hydrolase
MTEVSHGEVDPRSFDSLRGRVIHIHDELIYADAAAYFGMLNMWDTYSQQGHFGNSNLFSPDNEGNIVFIENDSETVTLSGMGYAIGHYARWINKGAIRIDAISDDPLLQVTAFRDDSKGRVVLVVINNAATTRALNVSMNDLTLSGNLNGEQSTTTAYWQSLTPFLTSSPSSFKLTVPAESVTTIAGQIGGVTTPTITLTPSPTSTNTPTPTSQPNVPGDADDDGDVDINDYVIWLNNYYQLKSGPQFGDFDDSGKVNGMDYVVWLTNYGQ